MKSLDGWLGVLAWITVNPHNIKKNPAGQPEPRSDSSHCRSFPKPIPPAHEDVTGEGRGQPNGPLAKAEIPLLLLGTWELAACPQAKQLGTLSVD